MTPKVVLSHIPLVSIFKLISDLIRFSKQGYDEDERAQLLSDLADIALLVTQDIVAS